MKKWISPTMTIATGYTPACYVRWSVWVEQKRDAGGVVFYSRSVLIRKPRAGDRSRHKSLCRTVLWQHDLFFRLHGTRTAMKNSRQWWNESSTTRQKHERDFTVAEDMKLGSAKHGNERGNRVKNCKREHDGSSFRQSSGEHAGQ